MTHEQLLRLATDTALTVVVMVGACSIVGALMYLLFRPGGKR